MAIWVEVPLWRQSNTASSTEFKTLKSVAASEDEIRGEVEAGCYVWAAAIDSGSFGDHSISIIQCDDNPDYIEGVSEEEDKYKYRIYDPWSDTKEWIKGANLFGGKGFDIGETGKGTVTVIVIANEDEDEDNDDDGDGNSK